MLDIHKTDPKLGAEVHKLLAKKGIETPFLKTKEIATPDEIAVHFSAIMHILGLDLKDDSLRDTPMRVAKMFLNETLWGLDYNNFPKMTQVENKMQYNQMLIQKNINVQSICEHHWQSILGKCHVAYIPNKHVSGLSKLNRIVEFFCRRPQVQERLTEQIFYALSHILQTEHVSVIIDAKHNCIQLRGIEDENSGTVTSKRGGAFESASTQNEMLQLMKL